MARRTRDPCTEGHMTLKTTFTERLEANPSSECLGSWRDSWICGSLFLRLLCSFPPFSRLLSLFNVNPSSQIIPSAHMVFGGSPQKSIVMRPPITSGCDNLSHRDAITLRITSANAAERMCSMTEKKTPHEKMKTIHVTFANAPCPKQNAT